MIVALGQPIVVIDEDVQHSTVETQGALEQQLNAVVDVELAEYVHLPVAVLMHREVLQLGKMRAELLLVLVTEVADMNESSERQRCRDFRRRLPRAETNRVAVQVLIGRDERTLDVFDLRELDEGEAARAEQRAVEHATEMLRRVLVQLVFGDGRVAMDEHADERRSAARIDRKRGTRRTDATESCSAGLRRLLDAATLDEMRSIVEKVRGAGHRREQGVDVREVVAVSSAQTIHVLVVGSAVFLHVSGRQGRDVVDGDERIGAWITSVTHLGDE